MDERLIFNESSNQDAYSVEETTDGYSVITVSNGFVILGSMRNMSASPISYDLYLIRIDSQGNRIF
jgi:hypothetical protein